MNDLQHYIRHYELMGYPKEKARELAKENIFD